MKSAATKANAALRTGRGEVGPLGGWALSASWRSEPAVAALALSAARRARSSGIWALPSEFSPSARSRSPVPFLRCLMFASSTARSRARKDAATAFAVRAAACGVEAEAEIERMFAFGSTLACTFGESAPTVVFSILALIASMSCVIRSFWIVASCRFASDVAVRLGDSLKTSVACAV